MSTREARVDKWLWAMRVFKTRTLATEACKKGRVSLGSADPPVIVKPSRAIHPGDVVHVRKSPITYTYRVLAVTENRLAARLVPEYLENITPQEQLDLLDVVRIGGFIDRQKGLGRPTKREGRELNRFFLESGIDDDTDDWEEEEEDD